MTRQVKDDVLYVTDETTHEVHAYLLAHTEPVQVSAILFANAEEDVHATARRMLVWAKNTANGMREDVISHLVLDHHQPGPAVSALSQSEQFARHEVLHVGDAEVAKAARHIQYYSGVNPLAR